MNNFMKRLLVAMISVGLAVCFGASSSVNAAEVRQEPVISISVKDMPLREFVAEVEKKCSYTFFYSVQVLEQAGKVTVNAENEPVSEVLKKHWQELDARSRCSETKLPSRRIQV